MLYPWQKNDYQKLASSFLRGNFHALLIYGGIRCGTNTLIDELLQFMLCHQRNGLDACGSCPSCRLYQEHNHPDLYILAADEAEERKTLQIKVNQIREVTEFVYRSSHLSGTKVVYLPRLQELNISSANALLKILEEPPVDCIFILQAEDIARVMPTIKSRCLKYSVTRPTYEQAVAVLDSSADIDFWLRYYDGEPLFEIPFTVEQKKLLIETLQTPSISNIFTLTKELDPKKIGMAKLLEFFIKWQSDLMQVACACSPSYFVDSNQALQQLARRLNKDKLYALQDDSIFLLEWHNHPLNHKLQLENLLLKYQQIYV